MGFKVGDRVKLVDTRYGDSKSNPVWNGSCGRVEGRVSDIIEHGRFTYEVIWDNGGAASYHGPELRLTKGVLFWRRVRFSKIKLPTIAIRLKCPCCRAKNRYWNKLLKCWDECDFCRGERKVKIFKWFKWIWYMKLKRIR